MLRSLIFALILLMTPTAAWAWGPEGHEIIAAIAQANLTPAARFRVASLLGGDSMMILDSNWADEIRDARPDTASWHYVNIPLTAAGYDARRDCRRDACVVAQIERQTHVLADIRASVGARADALRFLIHLVGDLHQPLHAADNHDRGGNDVTVMLNRRRSNLHHVWDDDVVEGLGRDPLRVARGLDAALSPQQKRRDSGGTVVDWANESLGAARSIYAPIRGAYLPADYAGRERALVADRLTKAGLRLAALLNGSLR